MQKDNFDWFNLMSPFTSDGCYTRTYSKLISTAMKNLYRNVQQKRK